MIPCPNCTHDTDEWDDHFGAQGWLCEPAPVIARVRALTKTILHSTKEEVNA